MPWQPLGMGRRVVVVFALLVIWSFLTQDPIVNSSPTVVNGTLYIGGANKFAQQSAAGRLYVFGLP